MPADKRQDGVPADDASFDMSHMSTTVVLSTERTKRSDKNDNTIKRPDLRVCPLGSDPGTTRCSLLDTTSEVFKLFFSVWDALTRRRPTYQANSAANLLREQPSVCVLRMRPYSDIREPWLRIFKSSECEKTFVYLTRKERDTVKSKEREICLLPCAAQEYPRGLPRSGECVPPETNHDPSSSSSDQNICH